MKKAIGALCAQRKRNEEKIEKLCALRSKKQLVQIYELEKENKKLDSQIKTIRLEKRREKQKVYE